MPRIIDQNLQITEYLNLEELPEKKRSLMLQARDACHNAYAPYSGFQVGAAVELKNGAIIMGNNQENAAYPAGLCAERVALFATRSQYPQQIIFRIAISACRSEHPQQYQYVTPCGGCRQVMMEYQSQQNRPIEVLMEGPEGTIYEVSTVDTLLPLKFSKNSLGSL